MTTELEDLVRSTLREHATSINTGPRWHGQASVRSHRWPALAAAAAVVLIAAGGSVWRLGTSSPDAVGGSNSRSCTTALPAAWRKAIDGRAYSIGTYTPPIDGVLADGSAVAAPVGRHFHNELLLVSAAGKVSVLYRPPAGSFVTTTDLNGSDVIANVPTMSHGRSGSGVADIVAINARTDTITHLLAGAPAGLRPPTRRQTQAVNGAVVQGDTVYWTVNGQTGHPGVVVGYDLRTHHYRRVATYTGTNFVVRDARGVFWRGGSIPAPHLPAQVAALAARTTQRTFDDTYVVTDGSHYAWARGRTVFWAGPNGSSAAFRMSSRGSGELGVCSVAGPFVLINTPAAPHTYHVLDTRTGVTASLHINVAGSVSSVGAMLYLNRPVTWSDGLPGDKTIPINTAKLPELHC